ncbi:response regulator, partial [Streptomyces swartbergensis]
MSESLRTGPESPPDGADTEVASAGGLREEQPVPWPEQARSRVERSTSSRVLVVDDNKFVRQLIRVNLELEGFEVVTASDGLECLEIVHQVRPDLVLLDVVMPRLDGLKTAARLRADPRTRDL